MSALACGNDDHKRLTAAVVRVTWPDGRFYPAPVCKGCLRRLIAWYVFGEEGERHPMQLEPIGDVS